MTELLNTRQVADELGVHINRVYEFIHEGSLRAFKLRGYTKGRHWRVRREDLERFINNAGQGNEHTGDTLNSSEVKSSDRSPTLPGNKRSR